MTSLAMIGLISTPSTCPAPNTSADTRSRPPPGPITRALNPVPKPLTSNFCSTRRYANAVSSYRKYCAFERSGVTPRIGVEAAESISMNRESGRGPVYVGLSDQSPKVRS